MKKSRQFLLAVALLVYGVGALASTCVLATHSCVSAGCKTITAANGSTACVCTNGTANPPSGCLIDTSTNCWDQSDDYACPDPVVDCLSTPDCTLTSQTCTGYGPGGLCAQYQQVYACTKSVKVCTKTKDINACTNVNTAGLQNQPAEANTHGLAKAMQALALVQAISKNISSANPPTLFQGTLRNCNQEAFCGGVNFQACCCDTTLKHTGGGLGCSQSEVALAGDRRQKLAHHLETCCSAKLPLIGCVAHEQSYCTFDSVLGRIIQEQGRQQLAALAAGGSGTTTQTPVTLSLYGPGAGGWLGPYNAYGNDVWVYQWPSSCSLPATPASTPATASTLTCPTAPNQLWWAACDGTGCTAPSAVPPNMPADPSLYTISTDTTPPAPLSVALSKYVVTTGTCSGSGNPACSYTLSGLTAGAATLKTDLSWALYGQAGWTPAVTLGTDYDLSGYTQALNASPALGGTAPTSVSIEYATANGSGTAAGSYTSATLPISIPATTPVSLSGTKMMIWGACSGPYYQCEYHVSEPGTAVAKPWDGGCKGGDNGGVKNPDCSGFTLTQFMLLDISKMNLGEWLATVKPSQPNTTALGVAAATQASTLATTASVSPPQAPMTTRFDTSGDQQTVLKLSASSCQIGVDCAITADAVSHWPTATSSAQVASVDLDWGDGTQQTLSAISTVNGLPVFSATHTYTTGGNFTVTADFNMAPTSTPAADPSTADVHQATAGVQAWIDAPPADKTQQDTNGVGQLVPPPP